MVWRNWLDVLLLESSEETHEGSTPFTTIRGSNSIGRVSGFHPECCRFNSGLPLVSRRHMRIKWNLDILPEVVRSSFNINDVCRKVGLRLYDSNRKTLYRYI